MQHIKIIGQLVEMLEWKQMEGWTDRINRFTIPEEWTDRINLKPNPKLKPNRNRKRKH